MQERHRKIFKPQFLVLIAPFIWMGPVLLSGKAIYWGTPLLQFVPWWTQAWRTLRLGELPLWNPLVGMGAPLLANYQSALLYPPTWLYFLFAEIGGSAAIAWGQALMVSLHIAWAGWGMVCLSKKLGWTALAQTVSALAFSLSGYVLSRSNFLSINATVAWLPWILLGVYQLVQSENKRKPLLILTFMIAMQLLAGHAQITWYSLMLAGAWLTFWAWQRSGWEGTWRAWLKFGLAGGWAAAITAVQLFPTAEYLLQSQRASAYEFSQAMTYSFWPWRFLTIILPNLFGSPAKGDYWGFGVYWEDAFYFGLISFFLVIAIIFKRNKNPEIKNLINLFLVIIGISFVFSLGKFTPVFPWFYRYIPTFDMFQAPSRFLIWAVFALSMLAGLGAMRWRRPEGRALYWTRLSTIAAVSILVTAGILSWSSKADVFVIEGIYTNYFNAFVLLGLFSLGYSILSLFAPKQNEAKLNPYWLWGFTIFLAIDLLIAGWGLNPGVDAKEYQQMSGQVASTLLEKPRYHLSLVDEQNLKFNRFLNFNDFDIDGGIKVLRNTLLPNSNILDDVSMTSNFDPMLPESYKSWMLALDQAPDEIKKEMLARMGVDYELLVEDPPDYAVRFQKTEKNYGQLRWASCGIAVPDGENSLAMIVSGEIQGSDYVLLEIEELPLCEEGNQAELIWTRSATHVTVQVNAETAGYIVLADTWYPGWRAFVDGQETGVYRADHLFRAIQVQPGLHEIEFKYMPASFYYGAAISLIALGLWLYYYKKEK